jgi:hypothetical protein
MPSIVKRSLAVRKVQQVAQLVLTGVAIGLIGSASSQPSAKSAATVNTFTDRVAWEAASQDISTVTFEGIAPSAQAVTYRTAAGLSVGGLTFVGSYDGGVGFYVAVVDSAYFSIDYNWGSGATLQGPALNGGLNAGGPNAKIRITLPPGTTAFGTDLMAFINTDIPITLTLSTGESFTQHTLLRPARAFLGVTSDTDIAYVDISTTRDVYTELDNVSVGQKLPGGLQLTGLVLKRPVTPGCKPVNGTVTLSEAAPAGGVAVMLLDTLASASVPAKVTVPAGATSKAFKVTTTPVAAPESGLVTASFGATTLDASLTVRPIGVASLLLTPNPVAGGATVNGTIKLDCKAQPAPIVVDLGSSNAAVADPVPSSVFIALGAQTAPFQITTAGVPKTTKVIISATAQDVTKNKALKVTP